MKTTPTNLFDLELQQNIAKRIAALRKVGTVGMSIENLRQCTPTPKTTNGVPVGGNLPWQYAQRFAVVVAANPAFVRFTNI